MISHECSSIKYKYCLLNYFVSSLHILPNSTLPNGEVQVTIFAKSTFPGCQVHFAKSQSQQCLIVKSMLPSQHSQATNSTSPNQHCQIVKSKFTLWTARHEFWAAHIIKKIWAVQCLNFFRSAETSAQKNQTTLIPPPPPKTSLSLFFSFLLTW